MNVQIMQCPSCGSPLPAPAIGTVTSCTYCGARLEVTKGSSGSPMAKLSEIKDDTSFIAKERARDHLRDRIEELDYEIFKLKQLPDNAEIHNAEQSAINLGMVVAVLVFIFPCILGSFGEDAAGTMCWVGFLAPFLAVPIGYSAYKSSQSKAEALKQNAAERHTEKISTLLAEKNAERVTLADKLDLLQDELDALAKKI